MACDFIIIAKYLSENKIAKYKIICEMYYFLNKLLWLIMIAFLTSAVFILIHFMEINIKFHENVY